MTLDEAVKQIEAIIPCVMGEPRDKTSTGQPYIVFGNYGLVEPWGPHPTAKTEESAVTTWLAAMKAYLSVYTGTLHWRYMPQIENRGGRWRIYSRFAVVQESQHG